MTPAEAAIRAKLSRGEAVTPLDHLTTIDDPKELAAFVAALKSNGRMTPEINTAALERQKQIGRASTHG